MASSLGIFKGKEMEVRIRFLPLHRRAQWHVTQELVTERDGSVVLTMRVADTLELRRWILSFGASAEVLAPESLRDETRKEAQAMVDRSER